MVYRRFKLPWAHLRAPLHQERMTALENDDELILIFRACGHLFHVRNDLVGA